MDATSKPLVERVIRGSFTAFIITTFGAMLAYLIRVFYSRTLSIENYGLFYAIFGLINTIAVFIDLGFSYSIVYLVPKYIKAKKYRIAWNIFVHGLIVPLGISLVVSLLLVIFAPFLATSYFKVPGSENLIYLSCIYLVAYVLLYELTQIFTGVQKEKYYSSIIVSKWLLTFIFSLFFLFFDSPNIIYFAIAWALGHILTALIFIYLLYFKLPRLAKNKFSWDSKLFRQMQSLAFPAFLVTVMSSVISFADSFFLTYLRGVKEVGIYNIAGPLTGIITIVLSPIQTLFLPLISHLMEGEKGKVIYIINKILIIVPFISIYFSLFIIMFPKELIHLIFGEKWVVPVELPVTILSIAVVASSLSMILGTVILGIGRVKDWLKMSVVLAIVNIALDTLLVWRYGVLGLTITATIMASLSVTFFLLFIKRIISITIPITYYMKLLFFIIIIYSTVQIIGFYPNNWISLVITGTLYSLGYFSIGYVLKVYDKEMLMILLRKK